MVLASTSKVCKVFYFGKDFLFKSILTGYELVQCMKILSYHLKLQKKRDTDGPPLFCKVVVHSESAQNFQKWSFMSIKGCCKTNYTSPLSSR